MLKIFKKIAGKTGLAPGSLVYIGVDKEGPIKINLMDFNDKDLEEKELKNIYESLAYKNKSSMTWINISGIHQVEVIEAVGKGFGIHPLVLEDILNTGERPKSENFGDYFYTVMKMLSLNDESDEVNIEQVSIITGDKWVITFQENDKDVFQSVRKRIKDNIHRSHFISPDYLTYTFIDAVVDEYFVLLDKIGERIEELENELLSRFNPDILNDIHRLKRTILIIRKSIWPLRETVSGLVRGESSLFTEGTLIYLRDAYDHMIEILETIDNFRDLLSGMIEIHLSAASNKMNEVMKVLTIIATIFIPLTFIAGVYGMNFKFMPELNWKVGYFLVLLFMGAVAGVMLLYFWKKKWL